MQSEAPHSLENDNTLAVVHTRRDRCPKTRQQRLTPGTISALPSSRHSATLELICSRTSILISPVSPEKRARKPCVRLLMTSISCSVTVCTTSLRFWSSPSGHCTNLVWKQHGRGNDPTRWGGSKQDKLAISFFFFFLPSNLFICHFVAW